MPTGTLCDIFKPIAAVLAVSLVSGCKVDPIADIYSSDLRAAAPWESS